MKNYLLLALCLIAGAGFAQKKKMKEDKAAILDMCGCYKVSFDFAETFAADTAYEFYDNYSSGALEWAFPVKEEDDFIQIQHLLIVGEDMIVKHWRQDWIYENTDLYVYNGDTNWKYKKLEAKDAKGQWTQKVFQVDDSPRYEGSATWVHADGRHYWESVADAPLPRREYTQRDDYNVMVRRNRHEITDTGWLHEQDNNKVMRQAGTDTYIASEKGWNTYTKVDDSECVAATKWWATNNPFWADVRTVWDEVFASKKDLTLHERVDRKVMYRKIFALGEELSGDNYDQQKALSGVREIIQSYIASDDISIASK